MSHGKRPTEHEILARARRGWSPSSADVERVRRAVGAVLESAAATNAAGAAPAGVWAPKVILAGLIAVASGAAGYWAGHRAGLRAADPRAPVMSSPQSDDQAPEPPVDAPAAALAAAPPPVPGRRDARGIRHRGTGAGKVVETSSVAIEVRALRNTERALRNGNPGLALAFLRELDSQVPHGRLTEERDAAATVAHCASGDRPFDVDLAAEFNERHANSVYRTRVEQACAATDSRRPGDSLGGRSKR